MMTLALTTPSIGGFASRKGGFSMLGVRGDKAGRPARITPRDLCRVVNPRRQPAAGNGLTSHCIGTHRMTSPYLDRPLIPLAVALPRMLEKIESQLADETKDTADNWHLRQRAELIRGLLAPSPLI
jgi:hypothetical protein